MSKESLERAFGQLLEAIDLCVAHKLNVPALTLVYSTIDIAGWLHGTEKQKVGDRFTEWVDKYLLPGSNLKCNALTLYGARCGVVHSFSPESDLSASGKVLKIAYAWKPSLASELEELVAANLEMLRQRGVEEDPNDYFVAVQGEDLVEALRKGVTTFLEDINLNPEKAAATYAKAKLFGELSPETARDMLSQAEALIFILNQK